MCAIVEEHTAGDPMRPGLVWTDRTPTEIQERLAEKDIDVGVDVIRDVLGSQGYRRRKVSKYLDMGAHADRGAQFVNLTRLKSEYLGTGDPVLSIDTKKRELLGTFYRDGRVYTQQPIRAFDHDFPSHASGVVIPYGRYDVGRNRGYIHLGTSRDTSAFACDSVGWWWDQFGHQLYPHARRVLLVCDGGGSNSATQYLFKEDLHALSGRLGLELRVGHYPPYCSKYNPIERRLFSHVTRACQGVLFDSVGTVQRLIQKTRTATGLCVAVGVSETVYPVGRKYTDGFKDNMPIAFDEHLPKWNYRAIPAKS